LGLIFLLDGNISFTLTSYFINNATNRVLTDPYQIFLSYSFTNYPVTHTLFRMHLCQFQFKLFRIAALLISLYSKTLSALFALITLDCSSTLPLKTEI
jgi:hypothetical protein